MIYWFSHTLALWCLKAVVGGLTGCSHADQHRGEVEGPRCRADEHGHVAAGHGAQTELNARRFWPTGLNDLCLPMFTCRGGRWRAWWFLVQLLRPLWAPANWRRRRPHRWFLDCSSQAELLFSLRLYQKGDANNSEILIIIIIIVVVFLRWLELVDIPVVSTAAESGVRHALHHRLLNT